MTSLTRVRTDDRLETWKVFYGDLPVGTIARLEPDPVRPENVWRWSCGIYPGAHPAENKAGITVTFEEARSEWQAAWDVFIAKRRPEDFEEFRRHRQYMAEKLAGRLPVRQTSVMRCACGTDFDSHVPAETQMHAPHIYLAQRANVGGC